MTPLPAVAIALVAFVVMEPLTYLTHRFVMHGLGRRFHRSHHRRWPTRSPDEPFLEGNDVFPAAFAGVTIVAVAIGFNVDRLGVLVPVCVGVTAYGAAYAFVHDVYVHERVRRPVSHPLLDRLAAAHELHHRFGGEPYGMLVPVVPTSVRRRAEAAGERRLDQTQVPALTPRRHSVVDSTVRTVKLSPPSSGSANTWSRSPSTESSG